MDTNFSTTTTPEKFSYGENFKRFFGGVHFQFPQFKHDHPPVVNVNEVADELLMWDGCLSLREQLFS